MPPMNVRLESEKGRERTVTIAAAKGGIGKTTTTAQVAYPMAQFGSRVLLIDLDANAGLSVILDSNDAGDGAVEFLDDRRIDRDECVRAPESWQPDPNVPFADGGALLPGGCVHIIPASGGIAESVGRQDPTSIMRLRRRLIEDEWVLSRYDIVLIDIPGADSVVVDLALHASKHLVLALLPESQGLRGFSRTLMRAQEAAANGLEFNVIGAVTSRYEKNRVEHRDMLEVALDYLSGELGADAPWIGKPVPSRAAVSESNRFQQPLARRDSWRDTLSNRTRSMDAVAAYSAIAVAIIREVQGNERADEIADALKSAELGEYATELLLSGVGVAGPPHEDDDYAGLRGALATGKA